MIPSRPTMPPMVAPTETALSRPGSSLTAMAPWVAAPASADAEIVNPLLELEVVLELRIAVEEVTSPAMGATPTSDVVVIAMEDEDSVVAATAVALVDNVAERIVDDVVPSEARAEATAYMSGYSGT